jgi:uncharacterized damage-inducible protein DinB
MFGRDKKSTKPELRCSFCNRNEEDVRSLIAGPTVYICDECVGICVDIIADDRRRSETAAEPGQRSVASGLTRPDGGTWPSSDAWCAFCGQAADLQAAFMIENRTLLCDPCVKSIASAASEAAKGEAAAAANAELARLEEQLRRSFEGEAWHGPSVLEALKGVTAETAFAHPVPGAHSIWELVLHLGGTYGLVLRRLQGDGRQLTPEEDWPPVPSPTESNWNATVDALRELNRRLRSAVLAFDAARLDRPLTTEPYTAYAQFIGVTQHDLYHAGQIAVLKKPAAATPPPSSRI